MHTIVSNTVIFATLIVVMIGEDGVLYSNGGVKVVRGWAKGGGDKVEKEQEEEQDQK